MTLQEQHFNQVIERLKYACSAAGSVGLGNYTRVHKKDLDELLKAFEAKSPVPDKDAAAKLERVRHFLTPESANREQLQEAVNLAVDVLAVAKTRGVEPEL
ncbi:MAG TPA: hypothetical protein VJ840_18715 [Gemmatimonadaceae bacterium]|nr:hypothetical protein [Gemmatimonadaceae bacterium]